MPTWHPYLHPSCYIWEHLFQILHASGNQPAHDMKMQQWGHQGGSSGNQGKRLQSCQKRFHIWDFSKITSSVLLFPKTEWNFCSFAMISLGWLCNKYFSSFLWHIVRGETKTVSARSVNKSCSTLCDVMDGSPPGSSVHENLQARILEWCRGPAWGTPPMAKVMRKEAWPTQRHDQASGNPLFPSIYPPSQSLSPLLFHALA